MRLIHVYIYYKFRCKDDGNNSKPAPASPSMTQEIYNEILTLVSPSCRDAMAANTDPTGKSVPADCRKEVTQAIMIIKTMDAKERYEKLHAGK